MGFSINIIYTLYFALDEKIDYRIYSVGQFYTDQISCP